MSRNRKKSSRREQVREAGQVAQADGQTLRSYSVGALPIINRLLERMKLAEHLQEHLPADGPRTFSLTPCRLCGCE